jgi:hypothetical protein
MSEAQVLWADCPKCHWIFDSGFAIGPGAAMINCSSVCPNCKSVVNLPDIGFSEMIGQVMGAIQRAGDPLAFAQDALATIRRLDASPLVASPDRTAAIHQFGLTLPKTQRERKMLIAILVAVIWFLNHFLKDKKPEESKRDLTPQTIVNVYNTQQDQQSLGDLAGKQKSTVASPAKPSRQKPKPRKRKG